MPVPARIGKELRVSVGGVVQVGHVDGINDAEVDSLLNDRGATAQPCCTLDGTFVVCYVLDGVVVGVVGRSNHLMNVDLLKDTAIHVSAIERGSCSDGDDLRSAQLDTEMCIFENVSSAYLRVYLYCIY